MLNTTTAAIFIFFIPLINFLICICFGRVLGQLGIEKITLFNLVLIFILSSILFFNITKYSTTVYLSFGCWIPATVISVEWAFMFDALTAAMLLIVSVVSALVHFYSFDYMKLDPHFNRFVSYLSLFTFFMVMLVSASNLVCMFVGWEGVGICSYLLISFWFTRIQANKSAIKALIVNRFGDCGVLLGILILANAYETVDISILSLMVPITYFFQTNFFGYFFSISDLVSLFFFIGVIGKSAQLGLHTWLPSAMEGPTPVSALIHAATMVTAGVFLLIRNSFMFEYSSLLCLIVVWGAITAIFSAMLALVQHDIKKIIAYSTCSQLGYMVAACGSSNYLGSLYHLINHAFFKALLFLSAGVVIHFLNNEQDLRKMGDLKKHLPFTYFIMLIATLSITGFPFLSGFYSKDIIVEGLFVASSISSNFSFWILSITALLTSYYSWRLVFYVFFSECSSLRLNFFMSKSYTAETSIFTSASLLVLTIGSIFSGYILNDIFINLNGSYLVSEVFISNKNFTLTISEFLPVSIKSIPTICSCFGFFSFILLQKNILFLSELKYKFGVLYNFLLQFGFFDVIYNYFIKLMVVNIYAGIFLFIDKGVLEKFGPLSFDSIYQKLILLVHNSFKSSILFYLIVFFYFIALLSYFS